MTGGAGYIGSHAAKALCRAGYRVVTYDNLIAGHREAVRYGPLVEGDIADLGAVRTALRQHEIFAVMHFAAFLDVGESVREPGRYYRNNVIGALTVLEAMAAESVRYFVLSSTCATYGEPRETPISETHPQQPINSYGETKLAVERALPHFDRAHGMHWVALRYFNAAGADPDGEIGEDHAPEIHLIPRAIEAATGGRVPAAVRRRLPDARRHLPARLHSRLRSGRCAREGAGGHGRDGAVGGLQPGYGSSLIPSERSSTRLSASRDAACPGRSGRAGRAIRRCSMRPRRRRGPSCGWTPRFPDLESMVRTAWAWHQSHPHGYVRG